MQYWVILIFAALLILIYQGKNKKQDKDKNNKDKNYD